MALASTTGAFAQNLPDPVYTFSGSVDVAERVVGLLNGAYAADFEVQVRTPIQGLGVSVGPQLVLVYENLRRAVGGLLGPSYYLGEGLGGFHAKARAGGIGIESDDGWSGAFVYDFVVGYNLFLTTTSAPILITPELGIGDYGAGFSWSWGVKAGTAF